MSYLGYVSKLQATTGWRFEMTESERWNFYPYGSSEPTQPTRHDGIDGSMPLETSAGAEEDNGGQDHDGGCADGDGDGGGNGGDGGDDGGDVGDGGGDGDGAGTLNRPHDSSDAGGQDGENVANEEDAGRDSGETVGNGVENGVWFTPTMDTLIVSFAGAALKIGGFPRQEFRRTLSCFEADQLFLMDPEQSWYLNDPTRQWKGMEYFNERLAIITKQYQHVMFIGASMGAEAALFYSHHATRAVVFNPMPVDLMRESWWRFFAKLGTRRVPLELRMAQFEMLRDNIAQCKGVVTVHVSHEPYDLEQASFIDQYCEVIRHSDCVTHHMAAHLKSKGELVTTLRSAFDDMREGRRE
eukprot:TRINITY_DN8694_c0_g1_i1.p2 TRINITY_DN8694_c0_g1~~TRINITY_DN8694_c0_g1_i1.p2  ORF type:complete len:355 (+),score=85.23 TRINITY_DN8694_c0_g1_i1:1494-2558(+)